MKLYHGTTQEAYASIKINGFDVSDKPTWDCSEYGYTYFWHPDKLAQAEGYDDDDDITTIAISRAFENAQIAAALHSNGDAIYVLEVEIPEEYTKKDDSCPNMSGAVSVSHDSLLHHGQITAVYSAPFSPRYALFVLSGLLDGDYLNTANITPEERRICQALAKSNIYVDELYEFNYQQIA